MTPELTPQEIAALKQEAQENHHVGGGYASYLQAATKYALLLKQERERAGKLVEALGRVETILKSKSFGENSFSWYREQLQSIVTKSLTQYKAK